MLITLSGESGTGKTTLLANLMHAKHGACPLESVTTRDPRPSDLPHEYIYVKDSEYDAMHSRGEFLWRAEVRGKRYATRRAAVDGALKSGVHIAILVPAVLKTLHAHALETGTQHAHRAIFLRHTNQASLRERLIKRGDDPAVIERTLKESLSWNEEAQTLGIRFLFIDASQTPEEICREALQYIDSAAQE